MARHRNKSQACPNCGTTLREGFEFCPQCGQENHDLRVPFRRFAYEFVESITHFDTRLWNTLKAIFTKPGQLTKDFVEGKRARYVHPARFYVFVSVIFFALLSLRLDHGIEADHNDPSSHLVLSPIDHVLPDSAMMHLRADSSFTHMARLPIDSPWYGRARQRLLGGGVDRYMDSIAQLFSLDTLPGSHARFAAAVRHLPDSSSLDVERLVPLWGNNHVTFPDKESQRSFVRIGANMTDAQADSLLSEGRTTRPAWWEKRLLRSVGRLQVGSIQGTLRLAHLVVKNISIIMFLLMPFTAVLLVWAQARRHYYWEHLIFSVHIHSIFFLFFSIALLFTLLIPFPLPEEASIPVALIALVYLVISLRRVYGRSIGGTVLRFLAMSFPYFVVFLLLMAAGFFWGLATL